MNSERKEKELTVAEKLRKETFNKNSEALKAAGYEEHQLTINIVIGNILGFIIGIPFVAIMILLYYLLNNGLNFGERPDTVVLIIVFLFNILICCNIIHEGIHGITYAIFTKNHFKDVEFGFILKTFTPYCACLKPLKKHQYLIGILMPGIILGVIGTIIGALVPIPLLFFSGIFQLWAAGGDILLASIVLFNKSKKEEKLYLDHPTEIGVVLFDK